MRKLVLVFLVVVMFCGVTLFSQELDPLLQLLVDKKVLTNSEAQSVQKEYDQKKKTSTEETKKAIDDATSPLKKTADALKGLKIGGTYFLTYQNGTSFSSSEEDGLKSYNKFVLKRTYFDVKKEIKPYLEVRFTPDLYQESTGNYNLRMKYLYADFKWKGNSTFSSPHLEVGLVHTPYLDFEESMNGYRMQDGMAIDRFGLISSADSGMMFGTNFGPSLPKSYQDEVNKSYPGKWGSFAIGIYNGGGYSSPENNANKVVMSRLSFRPFPSVIPGFQFTYFGGRGKGNLAPTNYDKAGDFYNKRIYPKFAIDLYMLSYQHSYFTLYGLYFNTTGNISGKNYYTPSDYVPNSVNYSDIFKGYDEKGYSYFAEVKLGGAKKWRLIGRYDYLDPDKKGILDLKDNEDVQKRTIFGIAYKLFNDNTLLLDYEKLSHTKPYSNINKGKTTMPDEERLQFTLQIKF